MGLLLGIIIGLFILVLLVVVHELGHAIAAKRNGVVVEEFGVGFPPRAWGKKVKKSFLGKNVLFSINWLPIGGFVKLKGENDAATKKGDFGAATFWQKTKILLAGVGMNWLVAVIIFSVLAVTGLPKIIDNQFAMPGDTTVERGDVQLSTIVEGSAAEQAGFEAGDTIVSLNGEFIDDGEEFIELTRANAGQPVSIEYARDDATNRTNVTLGEDTEAGVFGAGIGQREYMYSTWSAPIVGVVTTAQLSWETVAGVGNLFWQFISGVALQFSPNEATRAQADETIGEVSNSVAGPIGILGVLFPSASEQGFGQLLLLTGIISLTLAVMNTLPIPALDGGRWFVSALFKVLRKPLTKEREEAIHGTGFLLLLGLIVLITIADITKIAG